MYEYSDGAATWTEAQPEVGPLHLRALRVATFNVWFDAFEHEVRRAPCSTSWSERALT